MRIDGFSQVTMKHDGILANIINRNSGYGETKRTECYDKYTHKRHSIGQLCAASRLSCQLQVNNCILNGFIRTIKLKCHKLFSRVRMEGIYVFYVPITKVNKTTMAINGRQTKNETCYIFYDAEGEKERE